MTVSLGSGLVMIPITVPLSPYGTVYPILTLTTLSNRLYSVSGSGVIVEVNEYCCDKDTCSERHEVNKEMVHCG